MRVQSDHHGCEHRRAAARATFNFARKVPETIPKGYPGLQNALYHINSFSALILRTAIDNKCSVCNNHDLILHYFRLEYWQSYQLDSDSSIWKYTVCSIEYLPQHLNSQTLRETDVLYYIFDLKKELHSQLEQKWVISKSCFGKHKIELISL